MAELYGNRDGAGDARAPNSSHSPHAVAAEETEDEGGGFGSGAVWIGGLAVVLVLVVIAARARAQGAVPHVGGPTGGFVTDLMRILGIAILTSGVVLLVWGRWIRKVQLVAKKAGRRPPLTTAQRRRVIVAALIGAAVALVVRFLVQLFPPPREQAPPAAPDQPFAPPGASGIGFENLRPHDMPQAGLGTYLSAFGVLTALVLLAIVLMRRNEVAEEAEGEELGEPEVVARAVAAGLAAVQDQAITDPRDAIVACFAAMERALAGMGGAAAPRLADTPEEVLHRGIAGAALPERPARELLGLFHEARFSTHPMGEDDRRTADDALVELLRVLDGASDASDDGASDDGARDGASDDGARDGASDDGARDGASDGGARERGR